MLLNGSNDPFFFSYAAGVYISTKPKAKKALALDYLLCLLLLFIRGHIAVAATKSILRITCFPDTV